MTNSHDQLRVNGRRLWDRLMTMAQIGATERGGVCRVALTDEDRAGRDLFVRWCQEAGCAVTIDQMGNIFARRPGREEERPPILFGSHLDSQPTGGKFDGALGVLAALEVIETLNDHGVVTDAPLEIVSWTNEEGARFAPAMIASGVFAGVFDLEFGLSRPDEDGRTIGDELARIGHAGEAPCEARPYTAAFELHIEQGPLLEAAGKTIGIVSGVQGARWYQLTFVGKEGHAGTTPMERRQDPVRGAVALLDRFYDIAGRYAPDIRLTFGDIQASPGAINTIPGRLLVKVDCRHPDAVVLDEVDTAFRAIVDEVSAAAGLPIDLKEIWYSPPVTFAVSCIDAVTSAAALFGYPALEMASGAGHDAVYLSRVVPTGMIFIPCEDGLSHNELENISENDATAGANVLLYAVLSLA